MTHRTGVLLYKVARA